MNVDFLAVFPAAIAACVVGGLWYSPRLFGKVWMKEVGITQTRVDEMKKMGMGTRYALAFLICLVSSFCFFVLIRSLAVVHAGGAIKLALLLWAGFILPPTFSPVLWQGKSLKLFAINGAYYLVFLMVIGVLVAVL